MRYVLTRLLERDGKKDTGDTLLATASQPCQLGCAATTNKLFLPAKDNRAAGTLPCFRRRGTLLLAASGTQVRKDVFSTRHFSRREERLSQLLRLESSLYVIKCDL